MDITTNTEKKKLFSLFKQFNTDAPKTESVLLVDFYNTFIRAFSAIPTMNDDGLHTGGISGCLKSIGSALKLFKPDRCIIIVDGPGGSVKRRKLFKEYKQGRKSKVRLNRVYADIEQSDSDDEKLKKQLLRTLMYVQAFPVNILIVDGVEADDAIAYCATDFFKNSKVTIMSADKDFLQLVDDRVNVWSPTKKKVYGVSEIMGEYGFHPCNFALFRALDGDKSDNIDGIRGCGDKTALKAFPFLAESKKYTVDDLIRHSEANMGKLKVYQNVLDNKSILHRNYELMQLSETSLTTLNQLYVSDVLNKVELRINHLDFMRMITQDRMTNAIQDYTQWLIDCFGHLEYYAKSIKIKKPL